MRLAATAKRAASLLLALLLLCNLAPSAGAQGDDISGHWAEEVLRKWIALGWLTGDGDGSYRPNDSISRAEYITMVNRMKHYREVDESLLEGYSDIRPDKWYYLEVGKALTADYLVGDSETTLSLEQPILRQEAFAMMARFERLELEDADPAVLRHAQDGSVVDSWAERYVTAAVSAGLVAGDAGYLYPLNRITRAETVALLDRVHSGTRVFSFPGSFGPQTGAEPAVLQTVLVTAPDVTLRNTIVQQRIEVTTQQPGSLSLHNLRVFGPVWCNSRLEEVLISGCELQELELNSPRAEIVIDGGNHIATLLLSGEHSELILGGDTKVVQMTAAAICELQLDAGVGIEMLSLHSAAEVKGGGAAGHTYVMANGVVFDQLPPNLSTADQVVVKTVAEQRDYGTLLLPEPDEEDQEEESTSEPYRAPRSISLDQNVVKMLPNESRLLVKHISPDNATDQRVEWHSSNEAVAKVSPGGKVTAVAPGTAVITATCTDGGQSDRCTVTVE